LFVHNEAVLQQAQLSANSNPLFVHANYTESVRYIRLQSPESVKYFYNIVPL